MYLAFVVKRRLKKFKRGEILTAFGIYFFFLRYMEYNAHATCYTWKQLKDDHFVKLDMHRTLDQIGMPDESSLFENMGIDEDQYIPVVHVYFNDDLTYN